MMTFHQAKKIKPAYLSELTDYPNANPIFIGVNWPCVNFIRNHHGICLLCDKNCEFYDLNFCINKEVWVLYSSKNEIFITKRLANALIRHGANKVEILPVDKVVESEGIYYA